MKNQTNHFFARILQHKRVRSSGLSPMQWSKHLEQLRKFKKKQLRRVEWTKKRGICDYCHAIGKKLTREHLLPKCFGGKYVLIRVCRRCNFARSNSAVYPQFIQFIKTHPGVWKAAKREAEPFDAKANGRFLNDVSKELNKSL